MQYDDWRGAFQIVVKGDASLEAQVKYLEQLPHLANDKNATLEMKLETQRLEYTLWKTQLERDMEAQTRLYQRLSPPPPVAPTPPKKKRWWQR